MISCRWMRFVDCAFVIYQAHNVYDEMNALYGQCNHAEYAFVAFSNLIVSYRWSRPAAGRAPGAINTRITFTPPPNYVNLTRSFDLILFLSFIEYNWTASGCAGFSRNGHVISREIGYENWRSTGINCCCCVCRTLNFYLPFDTSEKNKTSATQMWMVSSWRVTREGKQRVCIQVQDSTVQYKNWWEELAVFKFFG